MTACIFILSQKYNSMPSIKDSQCIEISSRLGFCPVYPKRVWWLCQLLWWCCETKEQWQPRGLADDAARTKTANVWKWHNMSTGKPFNDTSQVKNACQPNLKTIRAVQVEEMDEVQTYKQLKL